MSITRKYNFKVKYDQFGRDVQEDYYDIEELILIEAFEQCVLDLKSTKRKKFSMIELGSNQAYYSMLFKSILKEKEVLNIMVEPSDGYIGIGKEHFTINNYEGVFINKSIGNTWVAHGIQFEKEETTVDMLIKEHNIKILDVLHSDIDGSELTMLEGSKDSLRSKKIKNAFILTHGLDLHDKCLNFLSNFDYEIVMNHTQNNIGADRLIIIKSR